MITYKNICKVSEKISKDIKNLNLDYKNNYHLYSDEGGISGNPIFFITKKVNKKIPYSTHHGKMSLHTIKDYILGRLCTWQLGNNTDFSELYTIKVI